MIPSGIKRSAGVPLKTRQLANGTIVIENAYEGRYTLSEKENVSTPIKGIRVEKRPVEDDKGRL